MRRFWRRLSCWCGSNLPKKQPKITTDNDMKRYMKTAGVLAMMVMLALAAAFFGADMGCLGEGLSMAAALPIFGALAKGPLMDRAGDGGGAGGGTAGGGELEPWQRSVLDGITKVKEQTATIEKNFQVLDKDAKDLSDKFAKHCKEFDGLPLQIVETQRTIQQIQQKIASERRGHFGSAIERISGDEQMRDAVNGVIRQAAIMRGAGFPISDSQKKAAEGFMQRTVVSGATPGSSYINDQLVTEIYSLISEYGIWNRFDVIPVSTKQVKLIVDSTDPDALFVDEGTAPGQASYAGVNVAATIKKILAWIGVSNEMLEDSEVNLVPFLLGKFANATARRMDHAAVAAGGAANATDGGFTGIFPGGTAAGAAGGNTTVEALDLEDFLKTMLAPEEAVTARPSVWVLHPHVLIRMLAVKDGNGRPIFIPSTDVPSPGAIGTILGSPVILSFAAPKANTASARVAAFGDPMGMAVCLRRDFEFAASDQVEFKEDKTVFRSRARVAAKLKQASAFGVLTLAAS